MHKLRLRENTELPIIEAVVPGSVISIFFPTCPMTKMNSRSFMKHFLRAETHRNLSPNKFTVQSRLVKLPLVTKYPEREGGAECRLTCQFPLFLKQIPDGLLLAYCRIYRTKSEADLPHGSQVHPESLFA